MDSGETLTTPVERAGERQKKRIDNSDLRLKCSDFNRLAYDYEKLEGEIAQWKASYYPLKEDFEGLRKNAASLESANAALREKLDKAANIIRTFAVPGCSCYRCAPANALLLELEAKPEGK